MEEVLELNWNQFADRVDDLATEHENVIKNVDFIVGMSRGGLFAAAMIATKYNIPLVAAYIDKHDHLYVDKQDWLWDKNILVIDDICRSGLTLKKLEKRVRRITDGKVYTMTVFNDTSVDKMAIPVISTDSKGDVKFPWDYDR